MASSKDRCCVLFALILSAEAGGVAAAVPIKVDAWSVPIKAEARILLNGHGRATVWDTKDLGTVGEVSLLAAFALKALKEQSCTGGDSDCKIIGDILKDMSLHKVKSAKHIEVDNYHRGHQVWIEMECSTSSIANPRSEHGTINLSIFHYFEGQDLISFRITVAKTPEPRDGPRDEEWTKGNAKGWINLLGPRDEKVEMNHAAFEEFKARDEEVEMNHAASKKSKAGGPRDKSVEMNHAAFEEFKAGAGAKAKETATPIKRKGNTDKPRNKQPAGLRGAENEVGATDSKHSGETDTEEAGNKHEEEDVVATNEDKIPARAEENAEEDASADSGLSAVLLPRDKSVEMNHAAFKKSKAGGPRDKSVEMNHAAFKKSKAGGLNAVFSVLILLMVAVAAGGLFLYWRRAPTRPKALVGGLNR